MGLACLIREAAEISLMRYMANSMGYIAHSNEGLRHVLYL